MIIVIRRYKDKVSGLILGDICYIYIFSLDIFLSNHFKKYYNFLKFQDSSLDPVLQKKVCQKSPSANVRICDKEALKVNNRKYKKIICKVFFRKCPTNSWKPWTSIYINWQKHQKRSQKRKKRESGNWNLKKETIGKRKYK